jgi:hypothetical protein
MLLRLIYQTLLNVCASSMKEGFDTISLLNTSILFYDVEHKEWCFKILYFVSSKFNNMYFIYVFGTIISL